MRESAGAAPARRIVGILLAAGKGKRFDASGQRSKLLQTLPSGEMLAVASARTLRSLLPQVIAVVRPGAEALAAALRDVGCEVVQCADAERGMGVSLAYALSHARDADGWVIALADMPYVQARTIEVLVDALQHGADIVAPVFQGKRGNPVGFGGLYLPQLLALEGDQGARSILAANPVTAISVADAGILCDIDTPDDLEPVSK